MVAYRMENSTDDLPGVLAHPPLIYLLFMAAGALTQNLFPLAVEIPGHRLVGILLTTAGFSLSSWSILQFFTHRVNPDPFTPTEAIITTGPFALTRNPIYLAFAMLQIGMGVWSEWIWIAIMAVPATAVIFFGVIVREERYLEAKFGDEYRAYCSRVRRWL